MAKYRVAVEVYQYYGVYVDANSPKEAEAKVQTMIDNGDDIHYDDEGDGDTRVVEGYTGKINEDGCFID